jgi:hypothetical protein
MASLVTYLKLVLVKLSCFVFRSYLYVSCFLFAAQITPHSWPAMSTILVNKQMLGLRQNQPPSAPANKCKEEPIDIFPFCRLGRNVIEIYNQDQSQSPLCVLIQKVRQSTVEDLTAQVKVLPEGDALQNVRQIQFDFCLFSQVFIND